MVHSKFTDTATTIANRNEVHDEVNKGINREKVYWYYSAQGLLASQLSKMPNIKTYKTTNVKWNAHIFQVLSCDL